FEDYHAILNGKSKMPRKITVKRKGFVVKSLAGSEANAKDESMAATVSELCSSCSTSPAPATPFQLQNIGDNQWVLKILKANNKMLVLEGADFLSVFEAPISPATSEEAIEFL